MDKIIVICGPTGVGKTKLSIELAKKLKGEIINADSTQIYKGLDIATAKVTEPEKENIPHHLLDIKDISEDYTVYDFQKDARKIIKEIKIRGNTPILVGGTGLYIKATLFDYKFKKEEKVTIYDNLSNQELYDKVKEIDNNTDIHINNRKRLIRFLNYYHNHHISIRENKTDKLLYPSIFIGLTTDRPNLYEIINKRVDTMLQNGLLEEAFNLFKSNIKTKAVTTPIGYKELFPYFEHKITKEEAIDKIKQNSRKYAKKQYTWFNHQLDVTWFDVNFTNFDETVQEVLKYINKNSQDDKYLL